MKKYISILAIAFLYSLSGYSQGGLQNIVFTAKPNATNGLDIYAKNISGSDISGSVGASTITLTVLVPSSITPQPTVGITTPIAGMAFGPVVSTTEVTTVAATSYNVYTFNGSATSSSPVDFASNSEVLLATYSFTGIPFISSTVLLGMLPAGGASTFDYCYIAPNGNDQTDYANPFYSDIASDPGLHNANGINDISTNSLSYLAVVGVSLPIKFTGFSATKQNDNAILNWATANEGPTTDHYEIERSLDAVDFKYVASVSVKGNGNLTSNSYTYSDNGLSLLNSTGVIYYRIKQVDKAGTVTYTEVKAVRLGNGLVITAHPNPVKDILQLTLNLPEASGIVLDLSDANGKSLQHIQMAGAKGANFNKLNLSGYASGNYLLKVNSGTEIKTINVIKE